jgi:sporulation protein YlmC with PRC-barrel domain
MPDKIVHVSSLAGSPLLDSAGERLGRVEDVIARLDLAEAQPPVVGLQARIGGRDMFVPIRRVEKLEPAAARTSTTKLNLAQFERRPGEVLLRSDVLDHSLINITTAKLVSAREVELACEDGTWRVAGIDASIRPRLWRLLPRRFRGHDSEHTQFVAWSDLEAFVGHVPTSRLKLASRRIARLHPAQIADLVEAASHEEGEEILEAVGEDKELEADVFEELDDEHQVEFLRERSDQEAAAVLSRMASDEPTCCWRSSRIGACRSSTCCRPPSSARSAACSATIRRQRGA